MTQGYCQIGEIAVTQVSVLFRSLYENWKVILLVTEDIVCILMKFLVPFHLFTCGNSLKINHLVNLGLTVINLLWVEVYFKMHSVFYFFSTGEVEDTERSYSLSSAFPVRKCVTFIKALAVSWWIWRSRARHFMGVGYVWFIIFARRVARTLCL